MSNEHGKINRLQEVEDLTDYINNGWLHSGESDGPTFRMEPHDPRGQSGRCRKPQ